MLQRDQDEWTDNVSSKELFSDYLEQNIMKVKCAMSKSS